MINRKNADIFLIFVAISWGGTFILVQNAIKDLPTFSFLAIRFFLATAIMFALFYKKIELNKSAIKYASLLGVFNFIAFATQTIALNYTSSAIVAFITGLNVVFVPLLAFLLFKKIASIYSIIAVLISAIGVYFLTMSGSLSVGIGEFLTLICAVFVALHINYTDILAKKENIYTLVTFQFLTISILSFIFAIFEDKSRFVFSYNVVLAIVITSVFATVFAFLVQTTAQKYTTATKTAIIFTLEPLTAAIFSYFWGEPLSYAQIFGAFLIIVAMLISELRDKIFFFNR